MTSMSKTKKQDQPKPDQDQEFKSQSPKVTLIIQGPYDPMLEKTLLVCADSKIFEEVIVSTWEQDRALTEAAILHARKQTEPGGIPITLTVSDTLNLTASKAPESLRLQLSTRAAGLRGVTTNYCVMQRSDEYYSLAEFVDYVLSPKAIGKIVFSNWIVRPFGYHPFHVSDHLIAGPTEIFCRAIESITREGPSPLPYVLKGRKLPPESILGLELLLQLSQLLIPVQKSKVLWNEFLRHFEMFDLDLMPEFQVMARRAGVRGVKSLSRVGQIRNPEALEIDFAYYRSIEHLRPYPAPIHTIGTIFRYIARKYFPNAPDSVTQGINKIQNK